MGPTTPILPLLRVTVALGSLLALLARQQERVSSMLATRTHS